jgi:hypothetical protein
MLDNHMYLHAHGLFIAVGRTRACEPTLRWFTCPSSHIRHLRNPRRLDRNRSESSKNAEWPSSKVSTRCIGNRSIAALLLSKGKTTSSFAQAMRTGQRIPGGGWGTGSPRVAQNFSKLVPRWARSRRPNGQSGLVLPARTFLTRRGRNNEKRPKETQRCLVCRLQRSAQIAQ